MKLVASYLQLIQFKVSCTAHNRILSIVHDIEFNYFPPRLGSRFVVDWFLPFGYTNFDVEFGLVGQVIKLFTIHSRYWIDICSFLFLQITVEIPISKSICKFYLNYIIWDYLERGEKWKSHSGKNGVTDAVVLIFSLHLHNFALRFSVLLNYSRISL